jgi:Histidine kinase-, DNA gyrase B-, and HSP90-like ATPase
MDSRRRLIPKPHIIKAIRARNWSLEGAIEELIDNSIGHGRANNVTVYIDNAEGVGVFDDGIGVKDINSIFWYGDATAYDDLSQIGMYGVGAKHAAIWLGNVTIVKTVRDGRFHTMAVDWQKVDRSGEWPLEYQGKGRAPAPTECGTQLIIKRLARYYQLSTSEKMARSFGQIFAPALRRGVTLRIYHKLAKGQDQILNVEPFTPKDLTDEIKLSGELKTDDGVLKWSGRAGLSASLLERFNAVHIAFQHRVIETTRDAFGGRSAPTLYVEIKLDETTPWKRQLSEHKDKVVRHRDELMSAINEAIKPLLDKSEQQAQNLALKEMTAPIESALNKALKGAGLIYCDPNEEPEEGGPHGDGPPNPEPGPRRKRKFTPTNEGDPAKEIKSPTGVQFDFRDDEKLEGRAYGWEISGLTMTVLLAKSLFKPIINWPPQARDKHVAHIIVGFVAHAIEMEYWDNEKRLLGFITKKLNDRLHGWATTKEKIAPYLYRELIVGARLPEERPN